MPKHILKGIAIGEATRLLTNTESPALYKYYKTRLQRKLKRRKYPRDIVTLVGTMKHSKRTVTLYAKKKTMYGDKLLPFRAIYNRETKVHASILRESTIQASILRAQFIKHILETVEDQL